MPSLTTALSNLLSSLFEILNAIFDTALSAIQSVFRLAQDAIGGIFDLMSGLVGFVLGNIVVIGLVVAVFVGVSAYRQKNRGGGITGGLKSS